VTAVGDSYDVIVLGLGGMGSAAARHLAHRGVAVLGLEQFTPAHALGSSHGDTRIVRKAYFEHPDYVPLLQRAYPLWDELDAEIGSPLFVRTGALMIGAGNSAVITGTLASARKWGLAHEVLDARQMRRRYPQFALRADEIAVFEADAGYVNPEAAVRAHLDLARPGASTATAWSSSSTAGRLARTAWFWLRARGLLRLLPGWTCRYASPGASSTT
jgi:sarcosine oxidase